MRTTPTDEQGLCNAHVSWWDGEYEGDCELPKDHVGPHYDGISCYTEEGFEVELKSPPPRPHTVTVKHYQRGQLINRQTQVINEQNTLIHMKDHLGTVVIVEITT